MGARSEGVRSALARAALAPLPLTLLVGVNQLQTRRGLPLRRAEAGNMT
jgi:hypothetical protein